jgi:LmbE family N-acetylglucosaminyl deacetylase
LVVVAHPDDEVFGPGGTLALLAGNNTVTLICVTDGDNPTEKNPFAAIRRRELEASSRVLGVHEVVFFDYPDGGLCNRLYHEVAGKIQKVVDRVKPTMLMTFEPRGISGHIDHMAVSMITSYVYRENKSIRELWYYCQLESRLTRPFNDHYFIYFPKGYSKDEVDMVIDTSSVWGQQVRAMRKHESQKKDGERIILARKLLPKEECFLVKRRKLLDVL